MFGFCYFCDAPFHLSRVSVDVSRAPQPPPSIGTLRDFIKILMCRKWPFPIKRMVSYPRLIQQQTEQITK